MATTKTTITKLESGNLAVDIQEFNGEFDPRTYNQGSFEIDPAGMETDCRVEMINDPLGNYWIEIWPKKN